MVAAPETMDSGGPDQGAAATTPAATTLPTPAPAAAPAVPPAARRRAADTTAHVAKRRRTAEAHLEVCPWCEGLKELVDAGWAVRYCAECNAS